MANAQGRVPRNGCPNEQGPRQSPLPALSRGPNPSNNRFLWSHWREQLVFAVGPASL